MISVLKWAQKLIRLSKQDSKKIHEKQDALIKGFKSLLANPNQTLNFNLHIENHEIERRGELRGIVSCERSEKASC